LGSHESTDLNSKSTSRSFARYRERPLGMDSAKRKAGNGIPKAAIGGPKIAK
jgi:hypothetical protein